eukprot:CAMPEP_0181516220 /NCGR_PEP_ID=MMETSP1110-20121109/63999_1 /TAXON_ID=174948 /ORGANISM="Symbiodinium sp., Strain CCMP421" /LENGTH=88 /DNA_ID=CAMNT_0023646305 /DNA_START=86 /DNA_END=353 /DNA_ORIENTATION=+
MAVEDPGVLPEEARPAGLACAKVGARRQAPAVPAHGIGDRQNAVLAWKVMMPEKSAFRVLPGNHDSLQGAVIVLLNIRRNHHLLVALH